MITRYYILLKPKKLKPSLKKEFAVSEIGHFGSFLMEPFLKRVI